MVNCIGALVRRGDGDTSAIWMVDMGFAIRERRKDGDKSERKRYCNDMKLGLGFILSLVQVLSTIKT